LNSLLPAPMKNFVDSIFGPPITFLDMIIDLLNRVSLVAGKGISLSNYFGFFSYLPGPLVAVVNSLLAAVMFLAILQLIKAVMRMYGQVKEWIKWW
jgi:hypothetical protein